MKSVLVLHGSAAKTNHENIFAALREVFDGKNEPFVITVSDGGIRGVLISRNPHNHEEAQMVLARDLLKGAVSLWPPMGRRPDTDLLLESGGFIRIA